MGITQLLEWMVDENISGTIINLNRDIKDATSKSSGGVIAYRDPLIANQITSPDQLPLTQCIEDGVSAGGGCAPPDYLPKSFTSNTLDTVSIPTLLHRNRLIHISIQLVLALLVHSLQTFYFTKLNFKLSILSTTTKTTTSTITTMSSSKLSFTRLLGIDMIVSYLYRDTMTEIKNKLKNDKRQLYSYLDRMEYVEAMVDYLLEIPWIVLSVVFIILWISFRIYLENVPIHSITGVWSSKDTFYPIIYISWLCSLLNLNSTTTTKTGSTKSTSTNLEFNISSTKTILTSTTTTTTLSNHNKSD
eukprot:gene5738-7137_t